VSTTKPGSAVEQKHLRVIESVRGQVRVLTTTWECDQGDETQLETYLWENTSELLLGVGYPIKIRIWPRASTGLAKLECDYRAVDAPAYDPPATEVEV